MKGTCLEELWDCLRPSLSTAMLWTAPVCVPFPKQAQASGGELSFSSQARNLSQCPFYMNEPSPLINTLRFPQGKRQSEEVSGEVNYPFSEKHDHKYLTWYIWERETDSLSSPGWETLQNPWSPRGCLLPWSCLHLVKGREPLAHKKAGQGVSLYWRMTDCKKSVHGRKLPWYDGDLPGLWMRPWP